MKRSKMIREIKSIIATCGPTQPTIVTAEQVLNRMEHLGMRLVDSDGQEVLYEPEEGWDAYLATQEALDQARDFTMPQSDGRIFKITSDFLAGKSFEDLAVEHNVTRERIRQIVCKARRVYKKGVENEK